MLLPFAYQEKPVRVVVQDATPWWVAKDVCACLDIKWSGDKVTLAKIPDHWKESLEIQDSQDHAQTVICISEPAIYKLAFRSNKPEAEAFTDWVASEVLPQIRRTGKYEITQRRPERPVRATGRSPLVKAQSLAPRRPGFDGDWLTLTEAAMCEGITTPGMVKRIQHGQYAEALVTKQPATAGRYALRLMLSVQALSPAGQARYQQFKTALHYHDDGKLAQ